MEQLPWVFTRLLKGQAYLFYEPSYHPVVSDIRAVKGFEFHSSYVGICKKWPFEEVYNTIAAELMMLAG